MSARHTPTTETAMYRLERIRAASRLPPGEYVIRRGGDMLYLRFGDAIDLPTLSRLLADVRSRRLRGVVG